MSDWKYRTEYQNGAMREVATRVDTGEEVASSWWRVDDESAECECGMRVLAWERKSASGPLAHEGSDE